MFVIPSLHFRSHRLNKSIASLFVTCRNPEVMEEYEAKVVVRRENYKRMKTTLEQQQEDFYIDEKEEK